MNRPPGRKGFTLVELLVAIGLLALVLVLLASMTNSTESSWRATSGKIEQFREASTAFESLTRRLSQATLNTYWDYDSPTAPTKYLRQSELRFISGNAAAVFNTPTGVFVNNAPGGASVSGTLTTHAIFFQAPLGFVDESPLINNPDFGGLDNLLNTWGYYVEYNQDTRPAFINNIPNPPPARNRYRLMEVMDPSNQMTIYNYTSGYLASSGTNYTPQNLSYVSNPSLPLLSMPTGVSPTWTGREWFMDALNASRPPVHVLAENIIALVLLPKLSQQDEQNLLTSGSVPGPIGTSLAPNYNYDSTAYNSNPVLNSQNQLPPVVQATMVAIDEVSAGRMKAADVASLNGELSILFSQSKSFNTDLKQNTTNAGNLESYLISHKINYRIFTSDIAIRAAKWSTN